LFYFTFLLLELLEFELLKLLLFDILFILACYNYTYRNIYFVSYPNVNYYKLSYLIICCYELSNKFNLISFLLLPMFNILLNVFYNELS